MNDVRHTIQQLLIGVLTNSVPSIVVHVVVVNRKVVAVIMRIEAISHVVMHLLRKVTKSDNSSIK